MKPPIDLTHDAMPDPAGNEDATGKANDLWLDLLLREAADDVAIPDHGFSDALLERLPPQKSALMRGEVVIRDTALPLWFRIVNALALTLGCAALCWWLMQTGPGLLHAVLPGATHEANSPTALFEGMFTMLALGGWLCWWSRATLNDLLWSTLSELK